MCATGFLNPCFGCIFILMKINVQETFQNLGGGRTYPKARHLSQESGGWVGCVYSSQLGQGRLAFSSSFQTLQLGREGQGMLRPEFRKPVLRRLGAGALVLLGATG